MMVRKWVSIVSVSIDTRQVQTLCPFRLRRQLPQKTCLGSMESSHLANAFVNHQ